MTRRKELLPVVGLVAVALATALAVVLVGTLGEGGSSQSTPSLERDVDPGSARPSDAGLAASGIEASGTIDPRITLFGDTIAARIDVLLDRRLVDPSSVRVATEFLPWEIVGQPTRVRRDSGMNTHLRTTYTLRCTGSPCSLSNQSGALEFDAARVAYAEPDAAPGNRSAIAVDWPVLLVYSRFAAANAEGPDGSSRTPWRADLTSFPAASYGVSPGVLLPIVTVLALALGAAGAVLAFIAIPRRRKAPEPEPEPEPERVIVLTPLEQALELLEDAERADGTENRRRALELVAEVLDLDHPDLARAARTLAWSEDDPRVEQTSGLATRVRATIDLHGNGSGNGRVP